MSLAKVHAECCFVDCVFRSPNIFRLCILYAANITVSVEVITSKQLSFCNRSFRHSRMVPVIC
jgi:hypothetical protein